MGTLTIDRKDAVTTVTLRNPGKLNAISIEMWRAIEQAFTSLSADESVRCIVVRGADGNFAAGADIAQFPKARGDLEQLQVFHREIIAPSLRAIVDCAHPLVALIEGFCIGGGLEIAACCDLRIAGASSRFGAPIHKLGFAMAPDELRALLSVASRATALELLLEGRILDALEARERGLVTRVVVDDGVAAEAYATAARIAAMAPLANRISKRLVRRLAPAADPLSEAEIEESFAYWNSHDHHEGVTAFLEKRPPLFRGA
ncbi:enoyl-CoA hydratase [Verrucomicrobia bacterium SCGC AG-212-E04]|nr:enoyl-CoA hydratase [Verrucomicrobia bacterium SCGC AG-212-E04]